MKRLTRVERAGRTITPDDLSALTLLTMVDDLPIGERCRLAGDLGPAAHSIYLAYRGHRSPMWAKKGAASLKAIVRRAKAALGVKV